MGFWDVTKRMLQGKPAFEMPPPDKDDQDDWGDEPSAPARTTQSEAHNGPRVTPEAWVGRCKYHLNGSHMQVYAHIHNHSQVPIFLDKIQLVNQTRELDYVLQPGQAWEFRIYDGAAPTNGAYTEANLYYRDNKSGEYFRARHFIEYNLEGGLFCVEELHPVRPIVDM